MVTKKQQKVIKFIVETLQKESIEFQITGGLAGILYGSRRPLADIDIEIYQKDVEKVTSILENYLILPWSNIKETDNMFDMMVATFKINNIYIDINQIENSKVKNKKNDWILQPQKMNVEFVRYLDLNIPVQDKKDLLNYKKILARKVDILDINNILK